MEPKQTTKLFKTFFDPHAALEYYLNLIYPQGYLCSAHQRICTVVSRKDGRSVFQCAEGRHQISIYKTQLFRGTKLHLNELLLILLCYYVKLNITQCRFITGINRNTIAAFYSIANSALSSYACDNFEPIGGPNRIVQIDECIFRRRKYKRGRRKTQIWIFGGVESFPDGHLGRLFVCRVPNRSASVLIPIIQKNIIPGTTIWSDEWRAYANLSDFGYVHVAVNHSEHFKDPQTGCCTNGIEGIWKQLRMHLPSAGIKENQILQHLGSFLGRKNMTLTFDQLLHIVFDYQPEVDDSEADEPETEMRNVEILGDVEEDSAETIDEMLGITDGLEEPEFSLTDEH